MKALSHWLPFMCMHDWVSSTQVVDLIGAVSLVTAASSLLFCFCNCRAHNSPGSLARHESHITERARRNLVHLSDQSIDGLLTVTIITTLDVVNEFPLMEATGGVGQLEGPQEVACLLEVGTDSDDFVDQILDAHNAVLAQIVLDKLVVGKSDTLLVDLAIPTLVDELADGLEVGVAVGDVWVDDCEHLLGGLGQLDEDTTVDLEKSEELHDLARLGSHLVDTFDSNHEDHLGLLINEEAALLPAHTSESDLLTLRISVLLDISLSALEDDTTLLFVRLLSLVLVGCALFSGLLLALSLLQQCLGDEDLILCRDRSVGKDSSQLWSAG